MSSVSPAPTSYAALSTGGEPNALVVDAVRRLGAGNGRALDIGAGPLNDTLFLLEAGWSVDAVDRDPLVRPIAAKLNNPHLNFIPDDIRRVSLEPGAYSLVVALHVLPFLPRTDFFQLIPSIVGSLSKGGILCCTLFGIRDTWARRSPGKSTFLHRSEATSLFAGLQSIVFAELMYDGVGVQNEPKFWHVFRCMFRR